MLLSRHPEYNLPFTRAKHLTSLLGFSNFDAPFHELTLIPAPWGIKHEILFATSRLLTWSFTSYTSSQWMVSWLNDHFYSMETETMHQICKILELRSEERFLTLIVLSCEPLYRVSPDGRIVKLVTAFVCSRISWVRRRTLPLQAQILVFSARI